MSGGGGGGDDYQQQQANTELDKRRARDALNAMFGQASSDPFVTRDEYLKAERPLYEVERAAWQQQQGEAVANRGARDALYSGVRDNAFTAGKRGLDEKRDAARRDLRFELFAKGLNGGSVDVDQSALLDRTYNQGVLDLGAKADQVRADMRNSDEQTRLGLLQSIDAGMDQGTALSSALSQLSVNNDRAAATAAGTALGDLFGDGAALYNASQARRGKSDASQALTALFSTNPRAAGSGSSGVISRA